MNCLEKPISLNDQRLGAVVAAERAEAGLVFIAHRLASGQIPHEMASVREKSMSRQSVPTWLSCLATQASEQITDAELLKQFDEERNEAAFRALLGRHGAMVLGVCRRILSNAEDAEDAFQATFVVLARRYTQVDRQELGPWLHEIARRTALKAKVMAQRRRGYERRSACTRPAVVQPDEMVTDLRAVLDEEIARLPMPLRTAVILCELQGLSRRQAAATLRCPESTLSSRLSAARLRLAKHLCARGVTLSLAALSIIVPSAAADRCITVIKNAVWGAEGTTSATVVTLSTEVIRTMSRAKKLSLLASLFVVFTACGSILTTAAMADQDRPSIPLRVREAKPGTQNLDGFEFVAFDGFDGQLGLNWRVIRPDDSHVSLRKNPGKLTIRTQRGSIHGVGLFPPAGFWSIRDKQGYDSGAEVRSPAGKPTGSTKNLYLIDNPLVKGGDFTATTCLVDFRPAAQYQQAGLLLFNDDDNYMKWTYEFNDGFLPAFVEPGHEGKPKGVGGTSSEDRPYFVVVAERDGSPTHVIGADAEPKIARVWLQVKKRGNVYDFFTSQDGVRFSKHGSTEWGRDGPKRIGLIAQNGGDSTGADIEAQFEFFELRGR